MTDERNAREDTDDATEAEAADPEDGQDQDPKQSREENTGLFDSAEHSDAPGPFGTGEAKDPGEED